MQKNRIWPLALACLLLLFAVISAQGLQNYPTYTDVQYGDQYNPYGTYSSSLPEGEPLPVAPSSAHELGLSIPEEDAASYQAPPSAVGSAEERAQLSSGSLGQTDQRTPPPPPHKNSLDGPGAFSPPTQTIANSDSAKVLTWIQTLGGSESDIASSVQQTSDGGYIVAGRTYSKGAGWEDALIIKLDSYGNKLWDRTFGGSDNEYASSVQQTNDSGYILVGSTQSYGTGGGDIWLIKTDSSGNKQWDRTFGGSGSESANSVRSTTENGYIIVGSIQPAGSSITSLWLIKTDSNGNKLWDRTYRRSDADMTNIGSCVQQTDDGGYIIMGSAKSTGSYSADLWLIKTDSSGYRLWDKTFDRSANDKSTNPYNSVQQTKNGGYILTGSYGVSSDVWLIRTDSNGNKLWDRTFGGSKSDYGNFARETNDGGYIIAASTESYGSGGDLWLIKTDSNGNKLWDRTFGGSDMDFALFIQQTNDNGYIMSGLTYSTGSGKADAWIVKTDAAGNVYENGSKMAAGTILPIESDQTQSEAQGNSGAKTSHPDVQTGMGTASVTMKSSWLRSYDVYLDGAYIGTEGMGADLLDGVYNFRVLGDMRHTIVLIKNEQSYPETGIFSSGASYMFVI